MKGLIFILMVAGSYAGSYISSLWGAGIFSMSSVLLSALGGFIGIWAGYKIATRLDLN